MKRRKTNGDSPLPTPPTHKEAHMGISPTMWLIIAAVDVLRIPVTSSRCLAPCSMLGVQT